MIGCLAYGQPRASQWQLRIQPLSLKWNCHRSKELRLQLRSLPSRASEKMEKRVMNYIYITFYNIIYIIYCFNFYPCLISSGSPGPKLWDQKLAGAHIHIPSVMDVQTRASGSALPGHWHFTGRNVILQVENVYGRDYPVARVKADSSEAEPQWQKFATRQKSLNYRGCSVVMFDYGD